MEGEDTDVHVHMCGTTFNVGHYATPAITCKCVVVYNVIYIFKVRRYDTPVCVEHVVSSCRTGVCVCVCVCAKIVIHFIADHLPMVLM